VRFRRRLADLDEFRDNHRVAKVEQHEYSTVLHKCIGLVREERRELDRLADGIKAHIVTILESG
jgi:hypothetical protein